MKKMAFTGIATMIASVAIASLTDGLVGYWPFEGNAKDITGNGNNGVLHGATLTTDRHGNPDSAYHFGNGKYISVPANSQLNAVTDFSLSFWVKVTSFEYARGEYWCSPICKGPSGNVKRQFGIQLVSNGSGLGVEYAGFETRKPVSYFPMNEWVHVIVTYANSTANMYVNGGSVSSGTTSYTKNSGNMDFGRDPVGDMEYLNGSMDEVLLYNRVLSSSEIAELCNGVRITRVVTFNANGGVGDEMEKQVFTAGKEQKLSKNTYTKDGCVFQGWAETKADADNGFVKYRDEADIAIDSDKTLFAMWANPALTLTAESADWSSGSITLRCTDADTSGRTHTYTLQYYDESTGTWKDVTSVQSASASASLTDTAFSSRLGGIPPVKYRVKDETGRASAECVTRNRYGLFVGVGHYSAAYQAKCRLQTGFPLENLPEVESNTERYSNMVRDCGKFDIKNLIGNGATKETLDAAFVEKAENVSPGDIFLFYVATHGDFDGTDDAVLSLYDDDYSDVRLKRGIDALADKGAAVICILSACQSEALVRQCRANVAVIAAANYQGSSTALFDEILMDYGWSEGWAGTSGMLTFGALAGYVEERYNALFRGIMLQEGDELTTRDVQVENRGMLSRITAGTCGTHGSMLAPATPSGFTATQATSKNEITLSWNGSGNVDYYVFYGGTGGGAYENYTNTCKTSMTFSRTDFACVESSSESSPVPFEIRAFNRAGVSSSAYTQGWVDGTWKIVFWAGKGKMVGDWMGMPVLRNMAGVEYFEKVLQSHESLSLTALPQATRDGYTFTGWISEDQKTCTKASIGMVLSKESDGMRFVATWTAMTTDYLNQYPPIAVASCGDIATAAAMTAANGTRTVGECYACGINPNDPNDDLKITHFEIGKDGKPVITLNHTEDGSGNSFMPRVKTLGKATLSDAEEWREVPEEGDPTMRFFKVDVEMP